MTANAKKTWRTPELSAYGTVTNLTQNKFVAVGTDCWCTGDGCENTGSCEL